ncbi:hypothetical protein QF205_04800 [Luteimonas composti]|uniref:Peptidase MA-like domain-containing protein n=1 Tax=Luteimonas composti TaxID=398257 RepID=A0ABT6MPM3_9GAMM|nr:hypothetical protein [Luteimonas composti]MDH7452403.1 hypothetical protein [Luteimonas composti]
MMQKLSLLLMACLAMPATARPSCPDLDAPPAAVCIAGPYGLAYAEVEKDAAMAARALEAAAAPFEFYLGVRPPPGVLVLSTSYSSGDARDFARGQGLGFGMSWLPASAGLLSRPDSRTGRSAGRRGARPPDHEGILRHELGHAIYVATFWPDSRAVEAQYGGPAADWLDEAVAMLLEPADSQRARASAFMAAWRASPDRVPRLEHFLRMPHPALALAETMRTNGRATQSGVVSMQLPAGHTSDALTMFYGHALVFAGFLVDASGDPRILRHVTNAAVAGADFETWLADQGASFGLPATLPLLEARWSAWLQQVVSKD